MEDEVSDDEVSDDDDDDLGRLLSAGAVETVENDEDSPCFRCAALNMFGIGRTKDFIGNTKSINENREMFHTTRRSERRPLFRSVMVAFFEKMNCV